jgi:hypothetical protein
MKAAFIKRERKTVVVAASGAPTATAGTAAAEASPVVGASSTPLSSQPVSSVQSTLAAPTPSTASSFVSPFPVPTPSPPRAGGTRSYLNGTTLTSTGLSELDQVLTSLWRCLRHSICSRSACACCQLLGGGVLLGTILLIEEDTPTRFSDVLLRYFVSEGVAWKHKCVSFAHCSDSSSQRAFQLTPLPFFGCRTACCLTTPGPLPSGALPPFLSSLPANLTLQLTEAQQRAQYEAEAKRLQEAHSAAKQQLNIAFQYEQYLMQPAPLAPTGGSGVANEEWGMPKASLGAAPPKHTPFDPYSLGGVAPKKPVGSGGVMGEPPLEPGFGVGGGGGMGMGVGSGMQLSQAEQVHRPQQFDLASNLQSKSLPSKHGMSCTSLIPTVLRVTASSRSLFLLFVRQTGSLPLLRFGGEAVTHSVRCQSAYRHPYPLPSGLSPEECRFV